MNLPKKTKKLFIIGDSAFAEVAYECFTYDSEYEVVGFAVERSHLTRNKLFGLPVIPLDEAKIHYDPAKIEFYAALVYSQLNRLRARLYNNAKELGYRAASYISSKAFVWHNAKIGEHCFIFEDNTIQPFVSIGNNVVLWSGNHIGHHSVIQDNCFIASHVVVSGFCIVQEFSFVGVNSTLANNIVVEKNNWIGPGVTLSHSTTENQIFKAEQPIAAKVSSLRFFKV